MRRNHIRPCCIQAILSTCLLVLMALMVHCAHSIHGHTFGLGTTEIGLNYRLRNRLPVPTVPPLPPGAKQTPHVNFVDPEFVRVMENKAHPLHKAAVEFYLHLALNHEVSVGQRSFVHQFVLDPLFGRMLSNSFRPLTPHDGTKACARSLAKPAHGVKLPKTSFGWLLLSSPAAMNR